jgi:cytochrome c biogenesis protein CcmG/thiol:disulfide interchange protein DsbE
MTAGEAPLPQPAAETTTAPKRRGRILALMPLAAFLVLAGIFLIRLGSGDASLIPSALIGKQAPTFDLPPLEGLPGGKGLSDADLKQGHVTLVNVFASWCVPCRDEAPVLLEIARNKDLAAKGVRLTGIAYKDDPANTRQFLTEGGNPYAAIGTDRSGRTGIDFGVYGVPETYVVRGDGVISYKFIGPLSDQDVATTLPNEIAKAMQGGS